MKQEDELTVVTNGYPICRVLSEKSIQTFSTGGRLLRNSMAFVGSVAEKATSRFNADLFFFSSSALDEHGIISDYSEEESSLRRIMFEHSRQSVFLCDAEKFNRQSAFRAFPLQRIHHTITNAPLSDMLISENRLTLFKKQDGAFWYINQA
jgi:DeoR family fructose operon transcriptional repressor